MPNYTTNFELTKPLPEEFYDIAVHNGNMDIIDRELKVARDGYGTFVNNTNINTTFGKNGWYLLRPDYSYTNIPDHAVGQWAVLEIRDKTATLQVLNGHRFFAGNIAVEQVRWQQFATTEDIASAGLTPATIE